jgi:hypothetical protein
MAKPSGNARLILKVKGPNCHMKGLHQKLTARFGHGTIAVRGMEHGTCSVVVKTADPGVVREHLIAMGLRVC